MTQKSHTNLGREKLKLVVAILGLLHALIELVTKVVSYGRGSPQFRVQLQPQG